MRKPLTLAALALTTVIAGGFALAWAPDRPVASLTERWATPPSRFVPVAGMQVHVRDEGRTDDPLPIVLLHGTSASLHTWDGWTDALARSHRVVRFDLPGFGLTGPAPDGDYSLAAYVRATFAVLDAVGVGRCILVGNSLGGSIAIAAAAARPDRVDRLILLDASPYPHEPGSLPIGFRIAKLPGLRSLARWFLPRRVIESSLREVYGDPSKVTPALVDRYYELTLREGNREAVMRRFAQIESGAAAAAVARVQAPTFILWGGRDRLIPPAQGERLAHELPGARLLVFPELGHVPQEEDPQRTVAAVRAFLDK